MGVSKSRIKNQSPRALTLELFTRVFLSAMRTEDTRALRLKSELFDLRAGYANRILHASLRSARRTRRESESQLPTTPSECSTPTGGQQKPYKKPKPRGVNSGAIYPGIRFQRRLLAAVLTSELDAPCGGNANRILLMSLRSARRTRRESE